MKLDKVKLKLTKYLVKSLTLKIGPKKKHTVANELITRMSIVEDYDNYYFPYFTIDISVPNDVYQLMIKNNQKIKANLLIQKGKFKEGLNVVDDKNKAFKNLIRGTFYVFMNEGTPEEAKKELKAAKKNNENNEYGDLVTTTILLYPYTFYKAFESVCNTCLEDVTLAEALTYVLNKSKVKNVLLSPPSTYKKYKQFIITPIPLKKQINRICNTYAIHKKGTLVFFSWNYVYLIDKQPKCTAYRPNEYKITYLVSSTADKASKQTGGCYSNATSKYNVLNVVSLDVKNNKEYTKKTLGNNVITVTSAGKITKTNKKSAKTTRVAVLEEGSNTTKALKQEIKESKRVLTIGFNDIDINMITPNKQFVMTYDKASYKKYNGKYRLTKVAHIFEKEGNYFKVSTTGVFKG